MSSHPPGPFSTSLHLIVLPMVAAGIMTSLVLRRGLTSTSASASIYKLIYTVPASHLAATKRAVFAAGGGSYDRGLYTNVSFESGGVGAFTPDAGAKPAIGAPGAEERVDEVRVEVRCEGLEAARRSVKALLRTHPYETVGYEVFKAEDALMGITKEDALKDD